MDSKVVEKFRVFGTECFVHVPKEHRKKWDKKAGKGYFVSYHDGLSGYRVYIPEKHNVVVSRNVVFKEETLLKTEKVTEIEYESLQVQVQSGGVNNGPDPQPAESEEPSEVSGDSEFYPDPCMFEESYEDFNADVQQPRMDCVTVVS